MLIKFVVGICGPLWFLWCGWGDVFSAQNYYLNFFFFLPVWKQEYITKTYVSQKRYIFKSSNLHQRVLRVIIFTSISPVHIFSFFLPGLTQHLLRYFLYQSVTFSKSSGTLVLSHAEWLSVANCTLVLRWRLRANVTKHRGWCSEGMEENLCASRSPFMIVHDVYNQVAVDKAKP